MIDTASRLAASHFEPYARLGDENEPTYESGTVQMIPETGEAVRAFADAGFIAAPFGEEFGGPKLPETVVQALYFIFATANIAFQGYGMLTAAAARMLATFGDDDIKARYLSPMLEGRFLGTMCLSEPQAGSSLSDITTQARRREDGTYSISGRKMWISCGDHNISENIIHLVLAKLPDSPPGVKGISLFVVPKYRVDADGQIGVQNDVALAGLNHKMGYKATTNCALNFGENGDCIGYLIGKEHQGLRYMFQMMNEARIAVGVGATALGQCGFQASLAYARERPQGRHPDNKDATKPQVLLTDHADIRRLLLAQKAAVEGALALCLYCASLVDLAASTSEEDERHEAELLLEMLTPITKSWPSEFCLEANKHALQVLGGAGYTRDYPIERCYRDNRLNPIHEGTHGIQGLDFLGRKVLMQDSAGVKLLVERIRTDMAAANRTVSPDLIESLDEALERFEVVTRSLTEEVARDRRAGLANATLFLDFAGHLVLAWMHLRILRAAQEREARDGPSDFTTGKKQSATYFFKRELVRTKVWAETLLDNDLTAYEADAACL
ncbi:acyl-CoA dehydrogenase [Pseudooceanicola batsensis]|uniref:acyl-CoA dehydrogenase n=1 Tax=Pseudooceanicola batsensis TaxID=314255 RepID=UPI0019308EC9|nr:acyl-CoA dehydrogenase [Pseudooceanicola batsensis]